jgi:putative ABC transport system permease protein
MGANRQRSFLTMLGVATGIFAITGILTMVNSLQSSLTRNISSLGNTVLFVHHWPWAEGRQEWYKFVGRPKASYRDFQKLKQNLHRVSGVSYEVTIRNEAMRAMGRDVSGVEVTGVTQDELLVRDLHFQSGRFFTDIESHLGSSVCIIGANLASNLFPQSEALGQSVRLGGKRLQVIGVQARQGAPLFPGMPNEDDKVYLPYRLVASMYSLNSRNIDKMIVIKAESHEAVPWVENETEGLVRTARGLQPRVENNFAINKQEALMERFNLFFGYLDTGGWVISLFSILIGGFSIGNIMYISVRERTMEIGVQKALGATNGFILYQFVMEALLLCGLGGILGLVMIFGVGGLIQLLLAQLQIPLTVSFSPQDVLAGLGVSLLIGLLAGIIPSFIAARLDPVEAIRA